MMFAFVVRLVMCGVTFAFMMGGMMFMMRSVMGRSADLVAAGIRGVLTAVACGSFKWN